MGRVKAKGRLLMNFLGTLVQCLNCVGEEIINLLSSIDWGLDDRLRWIAYNGLCSLVITISSRQMDRSVKFVFWSEGKPHFSDVRTCLVRQICQTGKQKLFGPKQVCILETEARDTGTWDAGGSPFPRRRRFPARSPWLLVCSKQLG